MVLKLNLPVKNYCYEGSYITHIDLAVAIQVGSNGHVAVHDCMCYHRCDTGDIAHIDLAVAIHIDRKSTRLNSSHRL